MTRRPGTLYFMCGKMAAGKTTLSKALSAEKDAVLFVQDDLFTALYPGEILTIPDFVKYSARLRDAVSPLILALLARGTPVVLDFPGNTRTQRVWFRTLFEQVGAAHELHYVEADDALCKRQLKQRSVHLAKGAPWTTDAEFDAITVYFQPPAEDESFNVIRHTRSG